MPSVKNPNGMSKIRASARSLKAKKAQRQISEQNKNKISRKDVARGARPGLLPNSGPRAKVSGKKARKLEKKKGYALKRKMDAEGIVEMTGKLTWLSIMLLGDGFRSSSVVNGLI